MNKRVKNYITADLAKKKIARYKYWSVKDENGITIASSDENNPDGKSFGEVLDKIIGDNVDAEVQVKYGMNEQSSRNNPPYFVKINEEIEWVEPADDDETVKINGVPHKVDKHGNVNINLTTQSNQPKVEHAEPVSTIRDELELQLKGLRQEYEVKEERLKLDLQNSMMEQSLKFKEMLLAERESRVAEREQAISQAEEELAEKQGEIRENLKGYLKEIPSALGGILKDLIRESREKKDKSLGEGRKEKKARKRSEVKFSIRNDEPENPEEEVEETEEPEEDFEQMVEDEIGKYEQEETAGTEQEATGDKMDNEQPNTDNDADIQH
ncbi:MAG: hypothetical protein KDD36_09285 [Flavobacteriales bacterium]|nr:hypothetical protein [Flavobacteriales bacterium]